MENQSKVECIDEVKVKADVEKGNVKGGEELEAISLFPEEVWRIIFDNMTHWEDLWNSSKTCLLFHKMLHRSKTTFLFPKIIPHLWTHLTGSEILQLRSISSRWNNGVDKYFENHPSLRPHPEDKVDARQLPFVNPLVEKRLGHRYVFGSVDIENGSWRRDFSNFIKHIGDHVKSRNPFIGRAVQIELPSDSSGNIVQDEDFFSNLRSFLETFGKHIYYLTILVLGDPSPREWLQERIIPFLHSEIFLSLPQLHQLRLLGSLGEHSIPALQALPSSPNLETLEIEEIHSQMPHPLYHALLTKFHCQLGRLHLQSWIGMNHLEWPNLVELHLLQVHKIRGFENMLRLRTPKLRKLGVSARNWLPDQEDGQSFDELLDVICQVCKDKPLETLRIQGEFLPDSFYNNEPFLPFPSTLTTLELEYIPDKSYSFLRRFSRLENLNLFWREGDVGLRGWFLNTGEIKLRNEQGEDTLDEVRPGEGWPFDEPELLSLDKHVLQGDWYKSNVWEVLPALKFLTFQRNVFTRECLQKYSENVQE